jgi:hypothetical protein
MKLSMSMPLSTAQRTCSNALAPCNGHSRLKRRSKAYRWPRRGRSP